MTRPTPISTTDYDIAQIIERPDGFYCLDKRTNKESGPFPTFLEAVGKIDNIADMEVDAEAGEDLKEIEEELGIADWIDPDTGAPAEESVPHIEDQ